MDTCSTKWNKSISGLRGVAYFGVMLGHFFGVCKYAQDFEGLNIAYFFNESCISFIFDEQFWVYLFYVISGYLIYKTAIHITSLKKLFFSSCRRFIRLGMPILFSSFVIYFFIYKVIGFYNTNTRKYFLCQWFQGYYANEAYSITDVLKSPVDVLLLNKCLLTNVYWCLSIMFKASLILYLMQFCLNKLRDRYRIPNKIIICILFFVFVISLLKNEIYSAFIIGYLGAAVGSEKRSVIFVENKQLRRIYFILFFFLIIVMGLGHSRLSIYFIDIMYLLFWGGIVFYVSRYKEGKMNQIFSCKQLRWLDSIGWGIYSFHFPIICSVGSSIFIFLMQDFANLLVSYAVMLLSSIVITLGCSVLYKYTFEKLSDYVVFKLKK